MPSMRQAYPIRSLRSIFLRIITLKFRLFYAIETVILFAHTINGFINDKEQSTASNVSKQ